MDLTLLVSGLMGQGGGFCVKEWCHGYKVHSSQRLIGKAFTVKV